MIYYQVWIRLKSSKNTPPPPQNKSEPRASQFAYKSEFDDIDALISGINTGEMDITEPKNTKNTKNTRDTTNEIDDLLSDFEVKSTVKTSGKNELKGSPKSVRSSTTADLSAIDDLLADLNF